MLLKSSSKNKLYEKLIKHQVITILERNLWGEPKWKNIIKNIYSLILPISTIAIISIFILTFIYFTVTNIHLNKSISDLDRSITSLNLDKSSLIETIENKDSDIDSLSIYLESREYIDFLIFRRANMDDFNLNMNRLSDDILFLMVDQANKYKIPYTIYFRLIDRESGFKFIRNIGENGGSGAFGYMQVMPKTFEWIKKILKLKGGHTEENNILVGSYMLRRSHDYWTSKGKSDKDAWKFCLAEYNAGRGKMQIKNEEGKVIGHYLPSYTMGYINNIMKYYK